MARTGTGSRPPRKSPRGKREDILAVATTLFGRDGYEDSKWADVASAVGIGSTALYHYFESKLHCLYVIMAEALATYLENFERITKESADYPSAIVALLRHEYDLNEQDGWQPELDDMKARITPRTRAIVLINPNNPTGSVCSRPTMPSGAAPRSRGPDPAGRCYTPVPPCGP